MYCDVDWMRLLAFKGSPQSIAEQEGLATAVSVFRTRWRLSKLLTIKFHLCPHLLRFLLKREVFRPLQRSSEVPDFAERTPYP
jgi:hypothetical protein